MKTTFYKKILTLCAVVVMVAGLAYAQNENSSPSVNDVAEETFTDMTVDERIAKLNELKVEHDAAGRTACVSYLQDRIDFLSN